MAKNMKFKLLISGVLMVMTLLVAVMATYTWYVKNNRVATQGTSIEAATTAWLFADFPEAESNEAQYSGQTGIEYRGDDAPYILTYTPVVMRPVNLSGDNQYLKTNFNGLKVTLAGTDEYGNPREEKYLASDEEGRKMLSNFTVKLVMLSYSFEGADGEIITVGQNENYVSENGYVVNETTREPLHMAAEYSYSFELNIVFQSEEGYALLQSTQADIDAKYTFPLSAEKYMFSHLQLSFSFGLDDLHKIYLNPNGGSCAESYIETTGGGQVTLPDAVRETFTHTGWFYDADCTRPFTADSLVASPIHEDMTIYAGWEAMPKVTFVGNGAPDTEIYVRKGTPVTPPAPPVLAGYDFVGWAYEDGVTADGFDDRAFDFNVPITEDVSLYAVWRKRHTVTLDIRWTSAWHGTIVKYVDGAEAERFSGDSGSREDYVFTLSDGETVGDYFTPKTEGTYFTFEENGSTYHFKGWTTDALGARDYDLNAAVAGDLKLYATFAIG